MRRAVEPWFYCYTLLAFTTTGIVPILLPLFVTQHGYGAFHVGLVLAAIGAGMTSAPLWGALVSRVPCHTLLGAGGAAAVCGAILALPQASDLFSWSALAFLIGVGVAASFTVSNLLILGNHPGFEVDARIGWLQTLVTVGTVAGLIGAGLLSHLPPREGIVLGAIPPGLAAILGLLTMRAPAPRVPDALLDAARTSGAHVISRAALHPVPARPASPAQLYALLAAWLLANVGLNAVSGLYPLLMRTTFRVPASTTSFVLSAATAVSALLYVKASRMTHVLGGRRVLAQGLAGRTLAFVGMAALAVSSLQAPSLALALVAAAGVAAPLLAVSSIILTAELSPDKARGLGLYNGVSAVAGLLGPVVGGRLADSIGYVAVLILAAACSAIGLMVTRVLPARSQ